MITADAFGAPLASTPARIICRPRPTPPVLATSAPSRPMRLHCRHPRLPPPRPTCVLHHPRHHRPSRRQRSGWSGCSQMAYRIRAATDSPSRHRHHSRTTASHSLPSASRELRMQPSTPLPPSLQPSTRSRALTLAQLRIALITSVAWSPAPECLHRRRRRYLCLPRRCRLHRCHLLSCRHRPQASRRRHRPPPPRHPPCRRRPTLRHRRHRRCSRAQTPASFMPMPSAMTAATEPTMRHATLAPTVTTAARAPSSPIHRRLSRRRCYHPRHPRLLGHHRPQAYRLRPRP